MRDDQENINDQQLTGTDTSPYINAANDLGIDGELRTPQDTIEDLTQFHPGNFITGGLGRFGEDVTNNFLHITNLFNTISHTGPIGKLLQPIHNFEARNPEYAPISSDDKKQLENSVPGLKLNSYDTLAIAQAKAKLQNWNNTFTQMDAQEAPTYAGAFTKFLGSAAAMVTDPVNLIGGALGGKLAGVLFDSPIANEFKNMMVSQYGGIFQNEMLQQLAKHTLRGSIIGAGIDAVQIPEEIGEAYLNDKPVDTAAMFTQAFSNIGLGALFDGAGYALFKGAKPALQRVNKFMPDNLKFMQDEVDSVNKNYSPVDQASSPIISQEAVGDMLNGVTPYTRHLYTRAQEKAQNNFLGGIRQDGINAETLANKLQESKFQMQNIGSNLSLWDSTITSDDNNPFNVFNNKSDKAFNVPNSVFNDTQKSVKIISPKLLQAAKNHIESILPDEMSDFDSARNSEIEKEFSLPEKTDDSDSEEGILNELSHGRSMGYELPDNVKKYISGRKKINLLKIRRDKYQTRVNELESKLPKQRGNTRKIKSTIAKLNEKINDLNQNKIPEQQQKIPVLKSGNAEAINLYKNLIKKSQDAEESGKPYGFNEDTADYQRLNQLAQSNKYAKISLMRLHTATRDGKKIFYDRIRGNALVNHFHDSTLIHSMHQQINNLIEKFNPSMNKDYVNHMNSSGLDDIDVDKPPTDALSSEEYMNEFDEKKEKEKLTALDDTDTLAQLDKINKKMKQMGVFNKMFDALTSCMRGL